MPTFIKTVAPLDAQIMLLGEAPGEEEDKKGIPFVGRAGDTLSKLLSPANIDKSRCIITNVARERPRNNDIKQYFKNKTCTVPTEQMQEWMDLLAQEIKELKPNIIIALGNTALYALTGKKGIQKNRGVIGECTLVPGQKFLATYHPQKVNYEWKHSFTTVMDFKKALRYSKTPDIPEDNRNFNINPTKQEWIDYCDFLYENDMPFAVDIEATRGTGYITRIGFAHNLEFAMSLKLLDNNISHFPEKDEIEVITAAARALEKVPTIYHNAGYDIANMWHKYRIKATTYMDTMITMRTLWPECPRKLDYCVSLLLDLPEWKSLSGTDQGTYNCYDAANTMQLSIVMEEALQSRAKIYPSILNIQDQDMLQLEPAMLMQLEGISVNDSKRKDILKETKETLKEIEQTIESIIGKKINLNSPKQVQSLLYIEQGLPVQYKRRKSKSESRSITSDESALTKLANKTTNPLPMLILKYREFSKRSSSFLDIKTSPEGKVHTSYNVVGTNFSRWSSSQSIILPYGPGNLQNIPEVTRIFYTAPPEYKIVSADYVQAEAHIVAFLSLDTVLMNLFKESFGMSPKERRKRHDLHKITASELYEIDIDAVTKEQRVIGKRLRHAKNYRMGIYKLAAELDVSVGEARVLDALYTRKNHRLIIWQKKVEEQLRHNRTIVNCFGRPHRFLDRWGEHLVNSAISYNPQSTIGDLMNRSTIRIYRNFGDLYTLWAQLHDGIYVLVEDSKVDQCIYDLRESMLEPINIEQEKVIIDVDFKVGDNWGELQDVNIDWR